VKNVIGLSWLSVWAIFASSQPSNPSRIVVIAPHPDDAEASCGGLIANAVTEGGEVVVLTMTGGEIGIGGKSIEEARAVRAQEARNAAAALGAKVEFFGGADGSLAVDAASTEKLRKVLTRLNPTIVVAPWPMDVHADHQASGILAWRVFQDRDSAFDLYFYETSNSPHTKSFQFVPTDYVDITEVMAKKQAATHEHKSQGPADWFEMYVTMARVHGYSSDVRYAEAYLKARNSSGLGGRAAVARKTLPGKD